MREKTPQSRLEGAQGTWVDDGKAKVLCPDGVLRLCRFKTTTAFNTALTSVKAKGKSVSGIIMVKPGPEEGTSVFVFQPAVYGANADVFNGAY